MVRRKLVFDVFKYLEDGDCLVFTTNGVVRGGKLVMGRGIALEVKRRVKGIEKLLGSLVSSNGNKVFHLGKFRVDGKEIGLVSFPTKHGWLRREEVPNSMILPRYRGSNQRFIEGWKLYSDINLIEKSLQQLTELELREYRTLWLPLGGTESGGLDSQKVLRLYRKYLSEIKANKVVLFSGREGILASIE